MQNSFNNYCRDHLFDVNGSLLVRDMQYYPSIALCALDAVMSIRLNYNNHVVPAIIHLCNQMQIPFTLSDQIPAENQQLTVNDFVERLDQNNLWDSESLRAVIGNYRTAGRHYIYKSEAFISFIQSLTEAGINTYQDLSYLPDDAFQNLENSLKDIPGQNVSVDYFFMLAGEADNIKVDTWLRRFSEDATGMHNLTNTQIITLFRNAAIQLSLDTGHNITPRHLDHAAWSFQRKL